MASLNLSTAGKITLYTNFIHKNLENKLFYYLKYVNLKY